MCEKVPGLKHSGDGRQDTAVSVTAACSCVVAVLSGPAPATSAWLYSRVDASYDVIYCIGRSLVSYAGGSAAAPCGNIRPNIYYITLSAP